MSITIDLPEEALAALRAEAESQGRDVAAVAVDKLVAAILLPPIPQVADEDAATYAALVAQGDADFAQGRFQTFQT